MSPSKLLLSLLLSVSCVGQALSLNDGAMVGGLNSEAAETIDCSTANVTFIWHMESTTVTSGTPAGCSDGDTTAALTGATISNEQAYDGTYSLKCNSTFYRADFDPSGIFNLSEGTVSFRVYITDWANAITLVAFEQGTTNLFYIQTNGTDDATGREVRASYTANGGAAVLATTTTADMQLDTWYRITCKWRSADLNPNLYIDVDGTATAESNTNLAEFSLDATLFSVRVSNTSITAYFDDIIVYDSWQ